MKKSNFVFYMFVAYSSFFIWESINAIGKMPQFTEPYSNLLPLNTLIILLVPFLFGLIAGRNE